MKNKTSLYTVFALILGVLAGLYLPQIVDYVSFIGTIYVNLLKFLIGPVIFTSITASIYKSSRSRDNFIIRVVGLFALMFIATFLLTTAVVYFINPSDGFTIVNTETSITPGSLSVSEIITNLFPSNLITMFQNNSLFSIILFSFTCGLCLNKLEKGKKVVEIIEILRDMFYQILQYIMYITPFAVFALIASAVKNYGKVILGVGIKYILTAYVSGILTLIIIMILPVLVLTKVKPWEFLKKVYKIWIITVSTCSSAATLPTTMKLCKEELGIDEKITDIVVPLGCTIHMCGGAVSFALLGLFCSRLFNVEVTLSSYLMMLASALIINMSAPGIPNGGVVIGATYLQILGIPLDFIGFYNGIYKILDMLYTTLNVTGDITANVIFSKKKK